MSSPQKRKRIASGSGTSSTETTTTDTVTKSNDIYFEDGNIVLIADNVAFRVHRGQLALHSEVFKDMLSLITEPQGGEIFDGFPVVRLMDSSQDLTALLEVMYGQIQFTPEMVDKLISVIRLSTKYLMDPVRASAVKMLAVAYPEDLDEWDAYQGPRRRCGDVLTIAVQAKADLLLPAAFYALCIQSNLVLHKQDLPESILDECFKGKDTIMSKLGKFLARAVVGRPDSQHCVGPPDYDDYPSCSEAWEDLYSEAHSLILNTYTYSSGNFSGAADPLAGLTSFMVSVDHSLCRNCRDELLDEIREERERIWDELPTYFGLGSWEELGDASA